VARKFSWGLTGDAMLVECLLLEQSGRSEALKPMSAFGGKADIQPILCDVCF
jgi:hypothetical protein